MKSLEFIKKHLGEHKLQGKEVIVKKCPICGREKSKFSVNIEKGLYQCFSGSCRAKGHINFLFKKFGEELSDVYNSKELDLKKYVCTLNKNSIEFLKSRGITKKTIDLNAFDICSTKNNETAFIYRKGFEVHSIKNRGNDSKRFTGVKLKELTLWKLDFADIDKPLIICEGELDVLSFEEQGILNAVSLPAGSNSFAWIDTDYKKLEHFKEIIIAVDNDEAGNKCKKELIKRLPESLVLKYIDFGIYKDANEVLKEGGDLKKYIDSAKEVDNDLFCDVLKDTEHETIRYSIGSVNLNRMIGTLRSGELSIITGSAGSGKSTVALQVLLELNKVMKTFVFSPELKLGQFKDWVARQLIPENREGYIEVEYCHLEDKKRYFVEKNKKNKMMEWFQKKTNYVKPDVSLTDKEILKLLENKFRGGEVKFALVDNLMKVEFESGQQYEVYSKHKDFISGLKKLVNKYNVSIWLVAHPKKHNMDDVDQYVVAGPSDITNLVDNIYYVRRCDFQEVESTKLPKFVKNYAEENQTNTLFRTLKSREGGEISWQHLHFDILRKRVKHVLDDCFYNTDWQKREQEMFPEWEGDK